MARAKPIIDPLSTFYNSYVLLLRLCLLIASLWPPAQEPPLPDRTVFMEQFRERMHNPNKLLSQYTYTETETEMSLDSKGKPKNPETNVYQIINGDEDWKMYRRHISKDGVPLTEKELEKQDRKERERVENETRKRGNWSEAKRREKKEKADREERETNDDIFAAFEYQLVRREVVGGLPTILVNFKPNKKYKPKTDDGKQFQHATGRLWISEDDHEIVKFEAELIEPIKFAAGFLAKVQKGSTLAFELRKINDEIWLPVKGEMTLNGKLLLLKGWNVRIVVTFSEFKKFNVDTQLQFKDVQ
jgi:hypothetical protein